jgi:F-type H+-transporting ATPase subunit epsilon
MATTQFELVTPTETLFSGHAEMIVCRTVEGEIAFLADHMPYIGVLDTGVVRIVGPEATGEAAGADIRVAVRGGFVEVKDNQVIMLADLAELATDVDLEAARLDETSAAQRSSGDSASDDDAADLRWAQARIEAASS